MLWFIAAIVVISALWLFLICPALRRHPDAGHLKGAYIAHRGLHSLTDGVPENSLTAFLFAVENGYAIENDIHITADGEVVVFHDDTVLRMCGEAGRVENMTLAQLKQLRLDGTGERIPTLQECLDIVKGRVPLLIEFKCNMKNCRQLCEKADIILSGYSGIYFVQSFYPLALLWYRRNRKEICRGQLAKRSHKNILELTAGALIFNFAGRPDFISYDLRTPETVNRRLCAKLGAIQVGWTFRAQNELDEGRRSFVTYIFEKFIPDKKNRQ